LEVAEDQLRRRKLDNDDKANATEDVEMIHKSGEMYEDEEGEDMNLEE